MSADPHAHPHPAARFTLRHLPLPAKLVITCFLIAVGLGYFSALVQMHLQHSSREGEPLPTLADVVEIFAGKKWVRGDGPPPPRPVSKFEALVTAPENLTFGSSGTMAPAFFNKDEDGTYKKVMAGGDEAAKAKLRAEREGERDALVAWVNADDAARRAAYHADKFALPADKRPKAITPAYVHENDASALRVKTLINERCVWCHGKGGPQEGMSLEEYDPIAKYLAVAKVVAIPPGGGYIPSDRQVSVEKLTQSTHAHLLSFAMLFSLTGLVFAFTSWPTWLRAILAPVVVAAQVADVSCWWLARLPESGPLFATAIIGTGMVVGMGLAFQIVLSLFNMYGWTGKLVLLLVFALGVGVVGTVVVRVIDPALKAQLADKLAKANQKADEGGKAAAAKPNGQNGTATGSGDPPKLNGDAPPAAPAEPSPFAHLLTATDAELKDPAAGLKWSGEKPGGMARAVFDKDEEGDFKKVMKEGTAEEKAALLAERDGERRALLAWAAAAPAARKAAYEADKFPLPPALAGKPLTADYLKDGAVLVKSLIDARCGRCHADGASKDDAPLDSYDGLLKYLGGDKPAAAGGAKAEPAAIPAAK